jgi:hypothetical protein
MVISSSFLFSPNSISLLLSRLASEKYNEPLSREARRKYTALVKGMSFNASHNSWWPFHHSRRKLCDDRRECVSLTCTNAHFSSSEKLLFVTPESFFTAAASASVFLDKKLAEDRLDDYFICTIITCGGCSSWENCRAQPYSARRINICF